MKLKTLFAVSAMLLTCAGANAQIGYQVAIIDQAKGTPKANETVSVSVTITDNSGATICTETQSGTTDEFGILSMQVGSASTFENADWSKLPLWISAKVGDITISKTQILSVPVAEYAKNTGELTKKILKSKTWTGAGIWYDDIGYVYPTLKFTDSTLTKNCPRDDTEYYTSYYICGNMVICSSSSAGTVVFYDPQKKVLVKGSQTYK